MIDFHKVEAELIPGWFSAYDMECLHPALAASKKDDVYLEIGVHTGRSLSFARKYFKGDVFGIDIETIKQRGGKVVRGTNFIHSDSLEVKWTLPIKVLFIDGEHRYERVKAEWNKYSPFITKGGWVFFHDCDETSPEVVLAFKEINGKQWKKTKSKNPRCSMAWVRKL